MEFKLKSDYQPTGDQPTAIETLSKSINSQNPHQTLLGVTGSGKTFTVANIIQNTQLPTLVICHNKTLASQLYQEFRDFFPDNAVSYFVSYYDYYQPEAYIPATDTYIEKEADINPEIDKFRLSTTANLLSRPDTIVIASVSCIYNIGSPTDQESNLLMLVKGQIISRDTVLMRLTDMQYSRTNSELSRGYFRAVGNNVQLYPSYKDCVISMSFDDKSLVDYEILDPLNYTKLEETNGGDSASRAYEEWVAILEVAIAKSPQVMKTGSTSHKPFGINGGSNKSSESVYSAITGGTTSSKKITRGSSKTFTMLNDGLKDNGVVVIDTDNVPIGAPESIVSNHKYTVVNTYVAEGKEYVTLRNPWGAGVGTEQGYVTLDIDTIEKYFKNAQIGKR